MDTVTILGICAGILTTGSFIPQVIKIYRTRETKDISLAMFIILSLGISLWLIYGFYINSLPVIIANSVTLALSFVVVGFKVRYK
ncbi:MAG: SemiSWEET family sugar transporter [Thermodesulfobacteriota bacterium]